MNEKEKLTTEFMVKQIRHHYGKSVSIAMKVDGDKTRYEIAGKDAGGEYMTFVDCAVLLNTEPAVIRRLNRKRARSTARFPFPQSIKLGGEITRFRRSEVLDWIEKHRTANIPLPFRS
jgi:predicted DNA-binding transcriptional regulator AlpA